MKQKVLAKVVAMAMAFLVTGCMPSAQVEGKILSKVEAGNETKENLFVVNTKVEKVPTAVTSPFAGDREQAQKAIAIVLLVLMHHSGKPSLR